MDFDDENCPKTFPLLSLQLHTRHKKAKADKAPVSAAASGEAELVPLDGVAWVHYTADVVETSLKHTLCALNTQLAIQHAPSHDDVLVLQDPRVLVAKRELPPNSLKIVPRADTLDRPIAP